MIKITKHAMETALKYAPYGETTLSIARDDETSFVILCEALERAKGMQSEWICGNAVPAAKDIHWRIVIDNWTTTISMEREGIKVVRKWSEAHLKEKYLATEAKILDIMQSQENGSESEI